MQVSLFNGFADKNPKPITIREVVEIIRADQRLQVLTENHRRYRAAGDTARADAEKQHMPCYSVAVLFRGGKQQKHIVRYTGMSIVDLDHVPRERMDEVLAMVRNDPHTLLAYTTISGEGVRVLARYALNTFNDNVNVNDNCYPLRTTCSSPLKRDSAESAEYRTNQKELSPFKGDERRERSDGAEGVKQCAEQYKISFVAINEYYKRLTGCDYDEKCKNATRLSGMAHDPEVYYNPDAVPMLTILVEQLLDPIRRRYGAPIIVTSGYRCPALNTAVGGVANSHHIVGCAADIVASPSPSQGGEPSSAVPESPLLGRGRGEANLSLFHLIIQMQREGAIRFTQLIAEKDYRWLHISYVPGMLRNQVIDVNINFDVNENDNCLPEGKRCEALSTLVQTSEMQASLRFLSESSQVSMTKSLTSALTLSLEETSLSTLKRDYQDSG